MPVSIVDEHPVLWHYTTAVGLEGILKSQQLWATNIHYLNDDEELRGFFERKWPFLLHAGINEGINQMANSDSPRYQDMLKESGDVDNIKRTFFQALVEPVTAAMLKLNVYVTSFCYVTSDANTKDGLLSQWRGYGHDGGYAIIFDTKGLHDLLVKEQEQYKYPTLNFSDVDYHHDDWTNDTNRYSETIEWERKVQEIVSQIVIEGDFESNKTVKLFEPIISLGIRHKHRGFKEECEVRIAAVQFPKDMIRAADKIDEFPSNKPVLFYSRAGVLVPYISFFEGIPRKDRKLPIKNIVVGPHPDKLKRQKAVQMLLDELDIEAIVSVSDIPFLGR